MIANIQGMLTIKQKAHLHQEISGYIDELQTLTTSMKSSSNTSRQKSGLFCCNPGANA